MGVAMALSETSPSVWPKFSVDSKNPGDPAGTISKVVGCLADEKSCQAWMNKRPAN